MAYPVQNQFLLAEDAALKALLTGIKVPTDKAAPAFMDVPVWFRFPESERAIVYPFITIDLIGIEPAYDLWESEWDMSENFAVFHDDITGKNVKTGLYDPSVSETVFHPLSGLDPALPVRRPHYLQYRLFYQISAWSKTFAHDRVLTAQLIRDVIRPRPTWLRVAADKTWRRMEPMGWAAADIPIQEGGIKRIFRKVFTLSVQAEIPQDRLPDIEQALPVERVALRGFYMDFPDKYWTQDETTDYWEVIVGEPRLVEAQTLPGEFPLTLYSGDSYAWRFTLWQDANRTIPSDLTDATALAQIKTAPGGTLLVNMATTIVAPNFVDVVLSAAQSGALPITGGSWDLQITQDADVRTVLKGPVTVQEDVST